MLDFMFAGFELRDILAIFRISPSRESGTRGRHSFESLRLATSAVKLTCSLQEDALLVVAACAMRFSKLFMYEAIPQSRGWGRSEQWNCSCPRFPQILMTVCRIRGTRSLMAVDSSLALDLRASGDVLVDSAMGSSDRREGPLNIPKPTPQSLNLSPKA